MDPAKEAYFTYEGVQQRNISFPLGGIGTGCFGISGSGRLVDWEIRNRPGKGQLNGFTHFAVRAEDAGKVLDARILNGEFQGSFSGDMRGRLPGDHRGFGFGIDREYLTGLPHFEGNSFRGFFPVAELEYHEPAFPGIVRQTAYSPFIPLDSHASSLPAAMFELEVRNTQDRELDYTVFGTIASPPGEAASHSVSAQPGERATACVQGAGADGAGPSGNEIAISCMADSISWQENWFSGSWFDALHVYWQDVMRGGPLRDRKRPSADGAEAIPRLSTQTHATLAAHVTVPAGEARTVRFAISWHYPRFEKYWESKIGLKDKCASSCNDWQNYYATQWSGASQSAAYAMDNWQRLSAATKSFRDELLACDLPLPVLDAVSANLAVLRSPIVARLTDGTLYGFEGCHTDAGCCEGSCTHVWNYQQAVPHLFPDLERSMREADFRYNQHDETGGMSFRLPLPLGVGSPIDRPCADGLFSNILKVFCDWRLSGDDGWLRNLWPAVKAALEFAWHPGNADLWDPERTGVLRGRQHHTLDMELFGPNPWLTGFYIAALRAAAQMAAHLDDSEAARLYTDVAGRGSAWVEDNLFNGKYYCQQIDLEDRSVLEPYRQQDQGGRLSSGDVHDIYWNEEAGEIKYQIGEGLSIDTALAQWHADLYGLGAIFDRDRLGQTLRMIFDNNFVDDIGSVANPCRIFGMRGESGTLICSWPAGAREPAIPVPYSQETMHGFEYAFGGSLLQSGEIAKGTRVFQAVRDRYRGDRRNPWNEIECGSNYARSMAGYAGLLTLSGFSCDMGARRIGFSPAVAREGCFRAFWSCGSAWGNVQYAPGSCRIGVLHGSLSLRSASIGFASAAAKVLVNGQAVEFSLDDDAGSYKFAECTLEAGQGIAIETPAISLAGKPELAGLA